MFCALSQSLGLVIFLYGVLYGLGLACAELLPFTVVARHFVRYRGAAIGMVFVGAATSGFVFPLITEALRKALEFHTVLLILGSLELMMLFGCIFVDRVPVSDGSVSTQPASPAAEHTCANSFHTSSLAKACCADLPVIPKHPAENHQADETVLLLAGERKLTWRTLAGNARSLASPAFLHAAVSRAVTIFVASSFVLTAVDFGTDVGLIGYEAVSLVTAVAVGDLLSRIGTGLLLDSKLLSGEALMMWSFALQTASMVWTALTKKYWVLLATCFFTGLTSGSRVSTTTVMVTELFDHKLLPISLGVANMVGGLFCLARPPLIGHARDVVGSYSMLYMAFAVISGVFIVTWMVSMCWQRCGKSQRRGKEPMDQQA
ncbi:monocarboxylate transporter 12-like isoform X2 [Amblyomma americanum]